MLIFPILAVCVSKLRFQIKQMTMEAMVTLVIPMVLVVSPSNRTLPFGKVRVVHDSLGTISQD
jgi:hypothetical protein